MKNLLIFLTEYKNEKAKLKAQEEKVNNMQKELEEYTIGNYEIDNKGRYKFTCGQYTVTVTVCTRTDIDKARLTNDHPEIMEEYKKTTEYTRTRVD